MSPLPPGHTRGPFTPMPPTRPGAIPSHIDTYPGPCTSRLETVTESGYPYHPTCQLQVGHEGSHRHGHFQDVMWSWSDDEAMPAQQDAHPPAPALSAEELRTVERFEAAPDLPESWAGGASLVWNELYGAVCGAGVDSIVTAQRVTQALLPIVETCARRAAADEMRAGAKAFGASGFLTDDQRDHVVHVLLTRAAALDAR